MAPEFQLADVGAAQLALIGAVALAGSILGGLAGYGTRLVVPIFLAPVVGIANVVPLKVHTAFMDVVVLVGGASFLWRAFA